MRIKKDESCRVTSQKGRTKRMINTDVEKELFNWIAIECRKSDVAIGKKFIENVSFWEGGRILDRIEEVLALFFEKNLELKKVFDKYYKQEIEEFKKQRKSEEQKALEEEKKKKKEIEKEERFNRLERNIESIKLGVEETRQIAENSAVVAAKAAENLETAAFASSVIAGKTVWDSLSEKKKSHW